MYTYDHPRPAVTVDIAIFRPNQGVFQVLLIQRGQEPFQGMYALPGGFLDQEESLEDAALRELKEETGIADTHLIQIHTFSSPDRDPRGRVISTCFGAILDSASDVKVQAGDDAQNSAWFSLNELPPLAFDHELIIQTAADTLLPSS